MPSAGRPLPPAPSALKPACVLDSDDDDGEDDDDDEEEEEEEESL